MKKNPFITSSHKFYIKDKDMEKHWVGNSLIETIDVGEFFNIRVIILELESILNNNDAIDASVVAEYRTEASDFSEVVKQDVSVNTERKKTQISFFKSR